MLTDHSSSRKKGVLSKKGEKVLEIVTVSCSEGGKVISEVNEYNPVYFNETSNDMNNLKIKERHKVKYMKRKGRSQLQKKEDVTD